MASLRNLARMTTATVGTGAVSLLAAVSGFNTFALAGVLNAEVVTYVLETGQFSGSTFVVTGREIGRGTYTSATATLSRDTVLSSTSAGAKISLTGQTQAGVTAAAQDFVTVPTAAAAHKWVSSIDANGVPQLTQPDTSDLTGTLTVDHGGTGVATLALNGVLYGNGAGAIQATTQGPAQSVLTANAGAPSFSATPTITGLTVNANATAAPSFISSSTNIQVVGADALGSNVELDSFAGSGGIFFRRANGTNALKSGLLSADTIGQIAWRGYDSAGAYSANSSAIILGFAAEAWSGTGHGAYLSFRTTPIGSTAAATERLVIEDDGKVAVGTRFVAAQTGKFNVNNSQSPTGADFVYFNVADLTAANGSTFTFSTGTSANPFTLAGSLGLIAGTVTAGGGGSGFNGVWMDHHLAAGTGGSLQGLLVKTTADGTWAPGAGATGVVAVNAYGDTRNGGFTWGAVPAAAASGTVAANIVGVEVNTQYGVTTTGSKVGIQIVDQLNNTSGTSTNPGTATAFQILGSTGAYGYNDGILFPAAVPASTIFGVRTTGTLIRADTASVANGIDFSTMTFSGNAWASPGASIGGLGAAILLTATTPTVYGGSAAGSALSLRSTSNGAPAADSVDIWTGGRQRFLVANSGHINTSLNATDNPGTPSPVFNGVHITSANASAAGLHVDTFGGATNIMGRRANGTPGAETALAANDVIWALQARGWHSGGAYGGNNNVAIQALAFNAWTNTDNSAYLTIRVTASGATGNTEVIRIHNSGGTAFGSTAVATDPGASNILVQSTAKLGIAGTSLGVLTMSGNTSGTVTIQTLAAAGTYTLTLPPDDGTPNQVLITDGGGILTWSSPGTGTVTQIIAGLGLAGGTITTSGTIDLLGYAQASMQVFTASGTWTKPSNVRAILVVIIGAGGGGGGVTNTAATVAGGGGGGGCLIKWATTLSNATETVTIGAGGTAGANTGTNGGTGGSSSMGISGTTYTSTGGIGGSGATASGSKTGGAGGAGSSGDTNLTGGSGGGAIGPAGFALSGHGGTAPYGSGGAAGVVGAAGTNGPAGGGGASGASTNSGGAFAGGVGGAGLVIVYEFK